MFLQRKGKKNVEFIQTCPKIRIFQKMGVFFKVKLNWLQQWKALRPRQILWNNICHQCLIWENFRFFDTKFFLYMWSQKHVFQNPTQPTFPTPSNVHIYFCSYQFFWLVGTWTFRPKRDWILFNPTLVNSNFCTDLHKVFQGFRCSLCI